MMKPNSFELWGMQHTLAYCVACMEGQSYPTKDVYEHLINSEELFEVLGLNEDERTKLEKALMARRGDVVKKLSKELVGKAKFDAATTDFLKNWALYLKGNYNAHVKVVEYLKEHTDVPLSIPIRTLESKPQPVEKLSKPSPEGEFDVPADWGNLKDNSAKFNFIASEWKKYNRKFFGNKLKSLSIDFINTRTGLNNAGVFQYSVSRATGAISLRKLRINKRLFTGKYQHFYVVLIHEMCHQAVLDISYLVNGIVPHSISGSRDPDKGHGKEWKQWMTHCGLEPSRYTSEEMRKDLD